MWVLTMISVIVPVYNIEKYLPRAIESILNQTVKDIELILVNDGSTDSSGEICEKYARVDSRINILHKENGGAASARNKGLDVARGELVSFVDGDDWIEREMLEELLEPMTFDQDIEVSIGTHVLEMETGFLKEVFKENMPGYIFQPEICLQMMERKYWGWELCGKLYRKQSFEQFRCNESIIHGEDLHSNWNILRAVKTVYYLPNKKYHYCMRATSVTHEAFSERALTWIDVLNEVDDETEADNRLMKKINRNRLLSNCIGALFKMFLINPDRYRQKILYCQGLLKSKADYDEIILSNTQQQQLPILRSSFSTTRKQFEEEYQKIADAVRLFSGKYKHVYIYGAGSIATTLAQIMNKESITFEAFVVSDRTWHTAAPDANHMVLQPSDLNQREANSIGIILAMNKKNVKEVLITLQQYGFKSFFDIADCKGVLVCNTRS